MKQILFFAFTLLFTVSFYSQTTEGTNIILRKQNAVNEKLNDFRSEIRQKKSYFNNYDLDEYKRDWFFRFNYIFKIAEEEVNAAKINLNLLPEITDQEKKINWLNTIENNINKGIDNLEEFTDKLINDMPKNKLVITKNNYRFVNYNDLIFFVSKKSYKTESQLKDLCQDRECINNIALKYLE